MTLLVTGASRGIGAVLARELAAPGRRLVLTARDADGLEAAAVAVRAAGAEAVVVVADIATEAGRESVLAAAGVVDVLVNNAGLEVAIAFADQTVADIDRQIAVNLVAPLQLTRAVLPGMIARGRGSVVMISSMSGKAPTPWNAVYAATKHGLSGMVSSVRIELEGTGVHIGVVCPSFVADAGMWSDTGVAAPRSMREVPLADVVAGVRAVIAGAAEVLVTPTPVRPLLALAALFPSIHGRVLAAMGVLPVLRARADAVLAKRRG